MFKAFINSDSTLLSFTAGLILCACLLWLGFAIKRRMSLFHFLIAGPKIISAGYAKAKGEPFLVETPGHRLVLVSSPKNVREMDQAPNSCLSLHAATKEILQPKYTMHGFKWSDRRGDEGIGFVRALRSILTSHLPILLPSLRRAIEEGFGEQLQGNQVINGKRHSPVFPLVKRLVAKVSCIVFFGEELSFNWEFIDAALQYPEDVLTLAELMRLTPKILAPVVSGIMTRCNQAQKIVFRLLTPIVEQRLELCRLSDTKERPMDCVEWLIDTSPRKKPWTVVRTVHEIMAVWFGSMFELSMSGSFALHDLCLHPEYVRPLRDELDGLRYAEFEQSAQGLPLLDSFIKESARMSPSDSISIRRIALTPFTFSGGQQVRKGDWACVPMQAMLLDGQYYSDPLQFHGFRFADETRPIGYLPPEPSKFTDVSDSWFVWGAGNKSCPVLQNYDCELLDVKAPRSMTWRSAIVPRSDFSIIFHLRELYPRIVAKATL